MIRAFRQSRLTAVCVFAASAALAVLVWIRDRDMPVYIPVIASLLLLLIGVSVGRLAGNLVADSCNTRLLGRLHVELDPEAFIRAYAAVPARLKKGSREYAIARAYLAAGYGAKGDFDAAIASLCPLEGTGLAGDIPLRGLHLQTLCAFQLGKEELDAAAKTLSELERLIAACGGNRARLAQNLSGAAALLRAELDCLGGRDIDRAWLEGQLRQASYRLRRLEILQTLARDSLRRGRREEAAALLEQLQSEGGGTWYAAWASEQRGAISV